MDDANLAALAVKAGLVTPRLDPVIPGVVSPVHRAVENACRLARDAVGGAVFLKTLHPDMTGFVDFAASAEASRKAGEAGIAPRLLLADGDSRTLVFEALDDAWRWGRIDDLRQLARFEALVAAKKGFHAVPPLAPRPSLFDLLEDYRHRARTIGLHGTAEATLTAAEPVIGALRAAGADAVPCHADGASSNVMTGPGSVVRLVDFEWARQSDPAHDLGTLLAELFPLDQEANLAVEIWAGRLDGALLARARLYGALDDLMWSLWGFLSAGTSARTHVEFTKYAEWRLMRARTVLEGARLPGYLARV